METAFAIIKEEVGMAGADDDFKVLTSKLYRLQGKVRNILALCQLCSKIRSVTY